MAKPVGDDAPAPAPVAAPATDPESPPGSDASESDAAADDEAYRVKQTMILSGFMRPAGRRGRTRSRRVELRQAVKSLL